VSSSDQLGPGAHPWEHIELDVYERHMSDARVGQLQQLHQITREQLAAYPARRVGVLGVAGGNGLDLIDPAATDAIFGFDINAAYLAACEARFRHLFGDRLHLVQTTIGRSLRLEPLGLVIANLIVEYVGLDEFIAFAAANSASIGTLSSVVQNNDSVRFVSATEFAASFDGLASVSSDIDPSTLESGLSRAGFVSLGRTEYPLPNGKILVRQDFHGGHQSQN